MASDQDKNKHMNIDEEEIVEVENDDSSDKKPTFRYRRLYDHVGQKSSFKKALAFTRTWSWPLVLLLLLLMVINYFIVIYFILKIHKCLEFSLRLIVN